MGEDAQRQRTAIHAFPANIILSLSASSKEYIWSREQALERE